jgi:pimeloyl-ACP methyl ester carboxylesterase
MSFIEAGGHTLEYETIPGDPVIVFLHEGLGSVAMWKDFPRRLAEKTKCGALIYSRYGYGKSDALAPPRGPFYMHQEALEALPELLQKLGIERPILFGHSDGGSIALIYAGSHDARGVIVLAPHVFVEELATEGIQSIRQNYQAGVLRTKLARYHDDPDSAFRGWSEIWLHPNFRNWNIEEFLGSIQCPVLAIQGVNDEYGTMEHLDRIAAQAPNAELLKIENARHSPHIDKAEVVLDAAAAFILKL